MFNLLELFVDLWYSISTPTDNFWLDYNNANNYV